MNNPVMMTDPDGRYYLLSQAFESSPDFNNNPQEYLIGARGRSDSWNALNLWMATVGNSAPIPTPGTMGIALGYGVITAGYQTAAGRSIFNDANTIINQHGFYIP